MSTRDIVDTVLNKTRRLVIILDHGGGDRSDAVAALWIFIPELTGRGFVFASV